MKKKILDRRRLRRIPPQFSWVDHRLIRQRRLSGCGTAGWALYLLLITVADADGVSYYSERSLCEHLGLGQEELAGARQQLLTAGLIAWEAPFYQVLGLEESCAGNAANAPQRSEQTRDMADILGEILKGGGQ